MKKNITFEVIIADRFTSPPDNRGTNLNLWSVPSGDSQHMNIDIEFETSSGDNMRDAEVALKAYIKKNYPNKDYKIYYWWWT